MWFIQLLWGGVLAAITVEGELFISEGTTCYYPNIENGQVDGELNGDMFVGKAKCDPDFELVGKDLIKCQAGIWSAEIPVCTKVGGCNPDDLAEIGNGRKIVVRRFRGSVVRYRCLGGYTIYGQSRAHCLGSEWSQTHPPICARIGCDESLLRGIPHGQSKSLMKGEVFRFRCEPGAMLMGSATVFCDGKQWNDTAPQCIIQPEPPVMAVIINGDVVDAKMIEVGHMVTLICKAQSGHPEPELAFYRNSEQMGTARKMRNKFTFRASQRDNNAVFTCTAYNGFSLMSRSDLTLNVKFPPGNVEIQGPKRLILDNLKEDVTVSCSSAPSNPVTRIFFHLHDPSYGNKTTVDPSGDQDLHEDLVLSQSSRNEYSVEQGGWITSANILLSTTQLKKLMNGMKIDCVGENEVSSRAMMDSLSITREFPPNRVSVTGPAKIKASESVVFTCQSSPAQPAARLAWRVEMGGKSVTKFSGENPQYRPTTEGDVTVVSLTLKADDLILRLPRQTAVSPDLAVECFASHPGLGEDLIAYAHLVEVLHPPGLPSISGLHSGEQLETGSPRELTCASSPAGHPPAKIQWYMGSQMMESHYQVDGDTALAHITFVPQLEYNGSELRCEAMNEAIGVPVTQTIRLDLTSNERFIEASTIGTTSTTSTATTTTTTQSVPTTEETTTSSTTTTSRPIFPETSSSDHIYSNEHLESYYDSNMADSGTEDIFEFLQSQTTASRQDLAPAENASDAYYYSDFHYDEYQDYDDEAYAYPEDNFSLEDKDYIHPELVNEALFKHKIPYIPPSTTVRTKLKKTEDHAFERSQNEVHYPKDSPYTADSSQLCGSLILVITTLYGTLQSVAL